MNFIFDFIGYISGIHKVTWFLPVAGIMFWFTIVQFSEWGAKQFLSMIGYTMILNLIAILFIPLGVVPAFWWAWGWNFAFIPVFNWWKPMGVIFTVSLILGVWMYNNGWDKEMDTYLAQGFTVPGNCEGWPCRPGKYWSNTERIKAEEDEAKAKKAAKAEQRRAAAQPKATPLPPGSDIGLPGGMYKSVK